MLKRKVAQMLFGRKREQYRVHFVAHNDFDLERYFAHLRSTHEFTVETLRVPVTFWRIMRGVAGQSGNVAVTREVDRGGENGCSIDSPRCSTERE